MQLHHEKERIGSTVALVRRLPFRCGPNKERELCRLIFEIARRDSQEPSAIIGQALNAGHTPTTKYNFLSLKNRLLQIRYPSVYHTHHSKHFYLPQISLDERLAVTKQSAHDFYPESIFIEGSVRSSGLAQLLCKQFPQARFQYIASLKEFLRRAEQGPPLRQSDTGAIRMYNQRAKRLFLIREHYDFLKPCPCTKGAVRCGYSILNTSFGCAYECSYCFLQCYSNSNGIIVAANISDFLKKVARALDKHKGLLRIGTGEFADSLALDTIFQQAPTLIDFFSRYDNALLELKTKSDSVSHILGVEHNQRTVIAWSLNPQSIIDSDEWYTASLHERLLAAQRCAEAGYPIAFHFDPIIYSRQWEDNYYDCLKQLFTSVDAGRIAWISLGSFRFPPRLKTIIEQRFRGSSILNEELILEFDNKLRYSRQTRIGIYSKMVSWIRSFSPSLRVYLCMEPNEVWKQVLGRAAFYSPSPYQC